MDVDGYNCVRVLFSGLVDVDYYEQKTDGMTY